MDPQELEQVAPETAPAPETPSAPPPEADAAPSGAAPAEKPDPKDRSAVIKAAIAERTNAAGRKIGADGKYIPTKAEIKASTQAPESAKTGAVTSGAAASPAPTQTQPMVQQVLPAPAGLTVAMKAAWGSLPPNVQAELARLDKTAAEAAGKAAQPYAEKAKQFDEMNGVIAPYLPMIQAEGGTPARAVASLLQTAAVLRTGSPQQRQHLIMQLAQQYGVQLPQGQAPDQQGQQAMPDIQSHPYVQQLAGTVQQLHGYLSQQQQAEQQRAEGMNLKAVQDFMGEVDDKGQPKFLLESGMQPGFTSEIAITRSQHPDWDARRVLEAAYENLSWKEPALRQLRLQKAEEDRRAKEQAELAAKKQAAVQVKGSGPATVGGPTVDKRDRVAVIKAAISANANR